MSTSLDELEASRHDRLLRTLPPTLLALGTVVALATGPATGSLSPTWRLVLQLAGVVAAAVLIVCWSAWGTTARPTFAGAAYYIGRSLLALLLTLLNPLFCVFAWIGFIDSDDYLTRRWMSTGVAATAVTMAIGQSGGAPWQSGGQLALFVALALLNFGLAYLLGRYYLRAEEISRERRRAITELEQLNAENAALHEQLVAQAREAGVRDERQRLAREIHDTIAQTLAGTLAQLQAAQEGTDPDDVRRRLDRATELTRSALAEARRSVLDLVPAPLTDATLADAITGLVTAWGADHPDTRAEVVVTGEVRALHPEVESTLVRVTQEALANVDKHAAADRVGVTLTYDEHEVLLDVRDDGVGFDPRRSAPATSFGLRGIRQRAERLAGAVELETEPGAGTAISLRLPAVERGAA